MAFLIALPVICIDSSYFSDALYFLILHSFHKLLIIPHNLFPFLITHIPDFPHGHNPNFLNLMIDFANIKRLRTYLNLIILPFIGHYNWPLLMAMITMLIMLMRMRCKKSCKTGWPISECKCWPIRMILLV